MFDLGWAELMVIGIVALIVVGPKDLPVLFRNVGQFVGKARGMAREFSRAMNDAADESGIKEAANTFKSAADTAANPMKSAAQSVTDAAKSMTDFDPDSQTGKLSKEREEAKRKIEANAARAAADRKMREAEEAQKKAAEMEAALKADQAAAAATSPAAEQKDNT